MNQVDAMDTRDNGKRYKEPKSKSKEKSVSADAGGGTEWAV